MRGIRGDRRHGDNCELPLEGVLLNLTLTQQWVELRILGFSKMIVVQTMAVHTATGNNLIIKGDLTRRSVVSRLDPKVAQPELRDFAYDPIADAKANRGELVAAVLTALMAYLVAGRPNRPRPALQSFVPWSDTVRARSCGLARATRVKTMDRLRKNDPVLKTLTAVAHAWRDNFDGGLITANEAVETANAHLFVAAPGTEDSSHPLREKQFTHNNLREALLQVANKGANSTPASWEIGYWLGRSAEDRVVDLGFAGCAGTGGAQQGRREAGNGIMETGNQGISAEATLLYFRHSAILRGSRGSRGSPSHSYAGKSYNLFLYIISRACTRTHARAGNEPREPREPRATVCECD